MIATNIRALIVPELRSWIGTPYHRRTSIKGVGVDCGLLPYYIYHYFGLCDELDDRDYLQEDWWCHTSEERYVDLARKYLRRVLTRETLTRAWPGLKPEFLPGNLVLAKVCDSKVFNHAGIITQWPRAVHAAPPHVLEVNVASEPLLAQQEILVFELNLES